jgi:hypothetical protein
MHPALHIQQDIYFMALHLPVRQTALNVAYKNKQTADVFWLAGV